VLRDLASAAGREIAQIALREGNSFEVISAHCSISNSACFENSRSGGGRAKAVQELVLEWLAQIPDEDAEVVLPTGQTY